MEECVLERLLRAGAVADGPSRRCFRGWDVVEMGYGMGSGMRGASGCTGAPGQLGRDGGCGSWTVSCAAALRCKWI